MKRALLGLAAPLLLGGCAQVGPVQAPRPHLPPLVADFQAVRLGPTIELRWTPPAGAAAYRLCIWPGAVTPTPPPPAPAPLLAANRPPQPGVPAPPVPQDVPSPPPPLPDLSRPLPLADGATMPACPQLFVLNGYALPTPPGSGPARLALAALNPAGQTAGWSNLVTVALGAVAPPPQLLAAAAGAAGVRLAWQLPVPPPALVEIFRQQAGRPPRQLATLPGTLTGYLDDTAPSDQQFSYWLRSARRLGAELIESADSAPRAVNTADVFPPPVPQNVQAVAAPQAGGVDLSWSAVAAPDLAGYNLYRQQPDGAWRRLNPAPLPTPVFHDPAPPAAGAVYAVTAVDAHGNESVRSASATAHN